MVITKNNGRFLSSWSNICIKKIPPPPDKVVSLVPVLAIFTLMSPNNRREPNTVKNQGML
jgi:hypothetical protein